MLYRQLTIWILLLMLVSVLHGMDGKRRRVVRKRFKRHDSEKYFNDYSAVSPYPLHEGQSPFVFVPNVMMTSPYSTCSWIPYGGSSNPKQECPVGSQNVLQTFIPLMINPSFSVKASQAQDIIKCNVKDSNLSIIETQSLLTLHCTLFYLDCYNDTEIKIIEDVMGNLQWSSFQLNLTDIGCNVDNHQAYLDMRASALSTLALENLVQNLETAITARGIQLKHAKGGNFHMTLATVKYTYPSDCIVNQLKQKLILSSNDYLSKKVCCFWSKKSDGWIIKRHFARDCSILEKLLC